MQITNACITCYPLVECTVISRTASMKYYVRINSLLLCFVTNILKLISEIFNILPNNRFKVLNFKLLDLLEKDGEKTSEVNVINNSLGLFYRFFLIEHNWPGASYVGSNNVLHNSDHSSSCFIIHRKENPFVIRVCGNSGISSEPN